MDSIPFSNWRTNSILHPKNLEFPPQNPAAISPQTLLRRVAQGTFTAMHFALTLTLPCTPHFCALFARLIAVRTQVTASIFGRCVQGPIWNKIGLISLSVVHNLYFTLENHTNIENAHIQRISPRCLKIIFFPKIHIVQRLCLGE